MSLYDILRVKLVLLFRLAFDQVRFSCGQYRAGRSSASLQWIAHNGFNLIDLLH